MKKKLFLALLVALTVQLLYAQPSLEDWKLLASNVKSINFTYGTSVRVKVYVNRYNHRMIVYDGDEYFFPWVERSDRKGYAYMYSGTGMLTSGLKFYFNLPRKNPTSRPTRPNGQKPQITRRTSSR